MRTISTYFKKQHASEVIHYNPVSGTFKAVTPNTRIVYCSDDVSVEVHHAGHRFRVSMARLAVMCYTKTTSETFRVRLVDATVPKLDRYEWRNLKVFGLDQEPVVPAQAGQPRKGVIYRFYNLLTEKSYIGQSINPTARVESHQKEAFKRGGTKFQDALVEYGMINFAFTILHDCDESDLDYWERIYIERYDSYRTGYNSTRGNKTK